PRGSSQPRGQAAARQDQSEEARPQGQAAGNEAPQQVRRPERDRSEVHRHPGRPDQGLRPRSRPGPAAPEKGQEVTSASREGPLPGSPPFSRLSPFLLIPDSSTFNCPTATLHHAASCSGGGAVGPSPRPPEEEWGPRPVGGSRPPRETATGPGRP